MKTFNSMEEMNPYYNEKTKTYDFVSNGVLLDIKLTFDFNCKSTIKAFDIKAKKLEVKEISACNVEAYSIHANVITAVNIRVFEIRAEIIDAADVIADSIIADDLCAHNITTKNINAIEIAAHNITVCDITADIIHARDINAVNINANEITYFAVCFALNSFKCKSCQSTRANSTHFCLDSEIEYKN